MIRAFSVDDVRRAEADAMAGLADGELMQQAAEGLADVVQTRLEQRSDDTVVALVGSGDNGGDTLYACARLAARGRNVSVVLFSEHPHAGGLSAARAAGCTMREESDADTTALVEAADLVLDGIAGIGGRAGLRPAAARVRDLVPATAYVVAVDLPSGVDPAGEEPGEGFFADETVTFSLTKPVHLLPAGELATGLLTVVDIGVTEPGTPAVERLTRDDIARLWPVPGPFDDKYSRGVLGLVAGSEQFPGAAVLAATSAATAGVGMLRYVGSPTPTALIRAAVPEAVIGTGRVQAHAVGPGMSPTEQTSDGAAQREAVHRALAAPEPCLLDAGALDLLDGPRGGPTLLTPHAGELARLAHRLRPPGLPAAESMEDWTRLVRERLVHVVRAVADQLDATVLLKGSVTLVVAPTATGLPIRSQADGPPWLGTAGTGDVLAGLAGMLLAAGLSPLDAGSVAAVVHGLAGHHANPGGPVRALDVARAIGPMVAGLLSR